MELDDLQNLLATPVPIIPRELCGSGHFGLSFESAMGLHNIVRLCGCAPKNPVHRLVASIEARRQPLRQLRRERIPARNGCAGSQNIGRHVTSSYVC
jgi:hypothetical protein